MDGTTAIETAKKGSSVLDSLGHLLEYLQPVVYALLECGLSESFEQLASSSDVDLMSTSIQHMSKALLSMKMSMEKAQLGAAKGGATLKEENAVLKRSLEAAEAERNLSLESANSYLNEKNVTLRTVDFQKAQLEK
ncbi:uncharacterized protein LOC116115004 [Pistacia vera]|uniref:uncharacterized protein LOC116115004 n=1 Tax=Pistacia vera TaxID=55513 RepID=UPI001263C771|nr:uncharacterized protein LOC116115004 [Pistacia vera]